MGSFERANTPEVQESFSQHEFGEMVETSNARAILVNDKYWDYRFTDKEWENWKQLRERTKQELEKLGFSLEQINILIPALVGIATESWHWSGVFIRPNVIMTAAHVLRDPESWKVDGMRVIANADQHFFKVKSIYYTKIQTEDIAFIVTEESTTSYLDLYNREKQEGENIYTLGLSHFIPRFTQWVSRSTFYQNAMWARYGGMDKDGDGKDDGEEYMLTDNPTPPWDSGWVAISNTGEVLGIVHGGATIFWKNVWWTYIEPQSKIVNQYWDFIQAMIKLWVEIK